jgi:hypothetical protein
MLQIASMFNILARFSRVSVAVLLAAAASVGCQVLFGDFDVEPNVQPPSGAAGGGNVGCTPNKFVCSGKQLMRCDGTGNWVKFAPCDEDRLCRADLGRCTKCVEGDSQCNGSTIENCNENLDGWVSANTCGGEQPICAKSTASDYIAECVACTKSVCAGNNTLQTCGNNRQTTFTSKCDEKCYSVDDPTVDDYCGVCTDGVSVCSTDYIRGCSEGKQVITTCAKNTKCQTTSDGSVACLPL